LSGPYVNGTVGGQGDEPSLVTVADVDTVNIDAALVRGKTISGHVTSARPAAISVVANGPGFGKATVDSAGNYLIQGLAPGLYQLLFRDVVPGPVITEAGNFAYGSYGPGGSLVGHDAALAIDVSSADAVLDPVRIPRGTDIVGQVTDGKVGLANAYLFVCDPSGILGCASATGRPDGTFRIVHVPSGSFQIFASAPGRVAGFYQTHGFTVDDAAASPVTVVSGGPDVKGIKIAIPAGGIVTGRITGPANEPITGAKVSVYPIGLPPNSLQPVSGPDGSFRQAGIPNNEYGLSVQAPAGTDYQSGFYLAGAPGNYTDDYFLAGTFRAVEDHDRVAPTITFRDPAAGATGVGADTAISVRFSEPVDRVSSSTMQLRDPRGRIVPASVTFTAFDRSAHLTPTGPLLPGTKYRLALTPGIVDWSGNVFAGTSWTFTTTP
jgi:hypothetical protein